MTKGIFNIFFLGGGEGEAQVESHTVDNDLVSMLTASAIPRKREKTRKTSNYRLRKRFIVTGCKNNHIVD